MKVFIIFALVCCLSVLAVSSKWVEEDEVDTHLDTEFDGLDDEEFSLDTEDKLALYEDFLDELIAAADEETKGGKCRKNCKGCVARCKPKSSKLSNAAWVKQCKKMRKCPPKNN